MPQELELNPETSVHGAEHQPLVHHNAKIMPVHRQQDAKLSDCQDTVVIITINQVWVKKSIVDHRKIIRRTE